MSMSRHLRVIKTNPLKTAWKNNLLPATITPSISIINKPKEKADANNSKKATRQATAKQIAEGKIKLPEQPKRYIKCPRYDFF